MYLIPIKEISTQECRLKQFTKYKWGRVQATRKAHNLGHMWVRIPSPLQ